MTLSDWLMIIAVLLSPFLAVYGQTFLNERKEKKEQKLWVFRTLMATRGDKISLDHVRALNSIDLLFSDSKKDKDIINKWKEYLDHLCKDLTGKDTTYINNWSEKNDDYLADLLSSMANSLKYSFDKVQIKKGIYFPTAHGEINIENQIIRKGLVNIFSDKFRLPIETTIKNSENIQNNN